jgi:transcriptional regulator with XRE-family HTH domain
MPEKRAVPAHASTEISRQELGDRLRMAREYLGLKQEEVARWLAVPRSALSHIERGQRKIDALELARLAGLYQRPLSWFTGEDRRSKDELPPEVKHVARAAASLSPHDRKELARFADFLKSRARAKGSGDGR